MRTVLFFAGVLAAGAFAQAAAFDHTHARYGVVLERFVRDGLVDYRGLHEDPAGLDAYLDTLAAVGRRDFERWSREDQIAFLVNLYNARTLRLIVDHYPVESIKDIGGWFRSPWKLPVVRLFGKAVTLDHVEHDVLRARYEEPRIHFALVCAAMGCPPLRREPYVGARLDAQLDDQGRTFLADRPKNRFEAAEQVLHLSPIFKWFREDFTTEGRTVAGFVRPFLPEDDARRLSPGSVRIRYTDYDWSLNERSRSGAAAAGR